jgi:hypothetical protein
VRDLLNWRQEILEDAPRAEVDLGVDQHAGDEMKLPALALEVAAVQVDQRAIFRYPSRCGLATTRS